MRLPSHQLRGTLLLVVIFWIVSAASFSGYISKWGLLDKQVRNGVEMMLEGTAHRPFVYRQLVPAVANFADKNVSDDLKHVLIGKHNLDSIYGKASGFAKPNLQFRYLIVCYCSFFALFGSMFVLRQILLDNGASLTVAVLAPATFALTLPYIQTVGGYFYDNVEILFLSITYWLALRGKVFLFLVMLIPATLNKETFFFYIPALYPLFRVQRSFTISVVIVGLSVLISGVVNLVIKYYYATNPGAPAEYHLWDNLKNYITPWFYRETEITYGLIGPARLSIVTIMVIAVILWHGWRKCSKQLQQHLLIAAAINIPLFLTFAATGELRNLSLLFVGLTIVLAKAIESFDGVRALKIEPKPRAAE